jgi:hypothetical protein
MLRTGDMPKNAERCIKAGYVFAAAPMKLVECYRSFHYSIDREEVAGG